MLRRYRFALAPSWWVLHLITVALVVTMILLGRWQLDVSESKHFNLRNFAYALQWWAFSGFTLAMWGRVFRDALRKNAGHEAPDRADAELRTLTEPAPSYRRYVMPQLQAAQQEPVDGHHAAYNDYLNSLAKDDSE